MQTEHTHNDNASATAGKAAHTGEKRELNKYEVCPKCGSSGFDQGVRVCECYELSKQEARDGYCWCDMCGFNAKLPAKFRAEVENDHPCPWCKEAKMPFLLCVDDELGEEVIPDEPMMTWPETDPRIEGPHVTNRKLSPCPFCGYNEVQTRELLDGSWVATCYTCGAGPSAQADEKQALVAWETRASTAKSQESEVVRAADACFDDIRKLGHITNENAKAYRKARASAST